MTLTLYDEAVERKLKKLYDNVIGAFPQEALYSSNKDGKVKLPLISFYRINNAVDWNNYSNAELFGVRGYDRSYNDETGEITKTLSIGMVLTYQIDLWASDRVTSDSLFHDILFSLMLHPNIELDMSDSEANKIFSMRLTDVQNSTDVPQFMQTNRLYRYTMTYDINEARMMYQSKSKYTVKEIPVIQPDIIVDPETTQGKNVPIVDSTNHDDDTPDNNSSENSYSPGVRIIIDDRVGTEDSVSSSTTSQHDSKIDIYPSTGDVKDFTQYKDSTKVFNKTKDHPDKKDDHTKN